MSNKIKAILEYWNFDRRSNNFNISKKEIEADTEISLFEQFYKLNN